ncbi:type III pantothenate kinase [Siphonobacter sp.]|uniref:type III pantothenate kinase n=1 Tax=Siphonobacter sp. TaxID=1869184 RepID=UPI003B3B4CFC
MKSETYALAIDLGNTYAKTGLFTADGHLEETHWNFTIPELLEYVRERNPARVVLSSTGHAEEKIRSWFAFLPSPILWLTPQTPVPLTKRYDTPHTLGADRVAAAIGARHLFPDRNAVVIDMGTCITYDYVDTENNFHGGLISPGLRMRFKAMHSFTQRLPLVEVPETFPPLVGKSTIHAMQSGVLYGLIAEVQGLIEQYRSIYPDFQVILCGGDAPLFESRLKEPIFAAPELVLWGLYRILNYNV